LKQIGFICSIFIFIFIFSRHAFAIEPTKKFSLQQIVNYKINGDGKTHVTYKSTITNLSSGDLADKFIYKINYFDLTNIRVYDSSGDIPATATKDNGQTSIEIKFSNPAAGTRKQFSWTLTFDTDSVLSKQGNVSEILIPRPIFSPELDVYRVSIDYKILGTPVYVQPKPVNQIWELESIKDNGISLIFLNSETKQNYSYTLNYLLSNKKLYSVLQEIPVPPDTIWQKSIVSEINPRPNNVRLDALGNWWAEFYLLPNKTQKISVSGYLSLNSPDKDPSTSSALVDLQSTFDDSIKEIKTESNRAPICSDFIQKFAQKTKSSGLLVRMIEGLLYPSRNSLHCWGQFFDSASNTWRNFDPQLTFSKPNWDYLNQWDFSHLEIVNLGTKTGNETFGLSDFVVKPTNELVIATDSTKLNLRSDFSATIFSGFSYQTKVVFSNSGTLASTPLKVSLQSKVLTPITDNFILPVIPPFGNREVVLSFSGGNWFFEGDDIITLTVNGTYYRYAVHFIPLYKSPIVIIISIISLAAVIFITTQISRRIFF